MNGIINLSHSFSRRGFLKTGSLAAGGLILGFHLPLFSFGDAAGQGSPPPDDLNAFIRIDRDGIVTLIVNKSEMGQGVYTSVPMLIAEELECDWRKVRFEPAPVAAVYNNPLTKMQMTGGSMSIRTEWQRMREVGAAGREMLIAAAAQTWKTDRASCRAENGQVIHKSGKSLTYGQLVGKAAGLPVPEKVNLKDPSSFKLLGKPVSRLDTPEKCYGKAVFGIDVAIPGMLTALVARPPVFGGKVKSFNAAKASAVPGVKQVVQIESGIAVIADGFWAAKRGRDALEITWDDGPWAALSSKGILEKYSELSKSPGQQARSDGNADEALAAAEKKISAEYNVPYLAHANMEPLNCVIDFRGNSCEIWVGTQGQTADRNAAAKILGLDPEQVKINTTYLGGGFGRRGNPHSDFVSLSSEVAKAVRKPVKVIWTREDDMKGGWYRPLWHDRISAGLDAKNNLSAWRQVIVGQSIIQGTAFERMRTKNGLDPTSVEGAADMAYEIPNLYVGLHSPELGVPVQWWRSVGHSHTGFVVESFMDEMAHAAGKDPYEFRRVLLKNHPRHLGVLDLAAEKAGWGKPLPEGRFRGIAMCESYGSFVSQVAEVSVPSSGRPRVHRVVCAIDCGRTVNPSIIAAQMESAIVFGLSAALYGEITLVNGRVEQSNFHNYRLLRMNEMPEIEVHIVKSSENPGGVGEPGVPPSFAALTNAIFEATGKRIRELPIRPGDLKKT